MKRQDYISWDEYFMGIALLSAMRSKDNNSQVGACIVSPENKILSLGYNGMPIGCNDDDMPWEREGDDLETKYMYVCHSELNAILNSPNHDLRGSRMYVTLFPCNECAKAIIQSGIKERLHLHRMVQPVRRTRQLTKYDMVRNGGMPKIDVNPETFDVLVNDIRAYVKPADKFPLSQLLWFS